MFASSFFRVRMHENMTHRGPAETLRELSVGKTMATGISREEAAEVAQGSSAEPSQLEGGQVNSQSFRLARGFLPSPRYLQRKYRG
jgi:hypothetical protein